MQLLPYLFTAAVVGTIIQLLQGTWDEAFQDYLYITFFVEMGYVHFRGLLLLVVSALLVNSQTTTPAPTPEFFPPPFPHPGTYSQQGTVCSNSRLCCGPAAFPGAPTAVALSLHQPA